MSSVTSIGTSSAGSNTPRSPNLYAQKADCERQLADWAHCVSKSTPQGKQKIEELRSKLAEINAQLQAKQKTRTDEQSSKASGASVQQIGLGKLVDAFA